MSLTSEKKEYNATYSSQFYPQKRRKCAKTVYEELQLFWKRLAQVKVLLLSTTSWHSNEERTQLGRAEVIVDCQCSTTLIFQEKGYWLSNHRKQGGFTNSFRWTLNIQHSFITVEHLRYGRQHPVFLFNLVPTKPYMLTAKDPHICGSDIYLANIHSNPLQEKNIIVQCWVIGPNKNDQLLYYYI